MPLVGNFRQFALQDVLRVIESGQRTGTLRLRRDNQQAAIYFSSGQWLHAERINSGLVLAQQFARAGLLHPEQFEAVFGVSFAQAGAIPDMQLVRMLINANLLTQEQLRAYAVSDAVALLTDVLAWPDGDFAFEDGRTLPQGRIALPLPIMPLITQAQGATRRNVPPREVAPLAPETVLDFAEIDPENTAAIRVTREQWRLLTAVDGEMPLWAISQRFQVAEGTVLQLAAQLVATGRAVIVGRVPPPGN